MKRTRAQILVMVALGLVGLMAMVALAVDGSRVYMDRRMAQNAADAAALAMAWEWLRTNGSCQAAINKGYQVAASLGYDNDGLTNSVELFCPPSTGQYAGQRGHFQALITTHTSTTFLNLVGWSQLNSTAEAVARASQGTLFGFNAIVALSETRYGGTFGGIKMNGNSLVRIRNGGMFSNSNASRSIWGVGSATLRIELDPGFTLDAVGDCRLPSRYASLCRPGVPQVDYETWVAQLDEIIPAIPAPPACTVNMSRLSLSNDVLPAGVYCVRGKVNLNNVTMQGKVVIVSSDNVILDGDNTAENLEIYATGRIVRFAAGSTFSAQRLRIYSTGSTDVELQGGARVSSEDTLIYLTRGIIDWKGNTQVQLCPPPPNDPDGFGGLVVYLKDATRAPDVIFRGNTANWMAGTFLAPKIPVQFNGNSDNAYTRVTCHGFTSTAGVPSQIIAYAVQINGNSYTYVDFDPNFLFKRPTIELLK